MKFNKKKQVPYNILIIFHIFLLSRMYYNSKNRKKLVAMYLSNIGFAYLFEYFVFTLFHSYQYRPSFIMNKTLDNVIGAILSQGIFIPIAGVFTSTYQISRIGRIAISFFFVLIERLFIKIGVFKTNWWKTMYTALLLPFYFSFISFWEKQWIVKKNKVVSFFTLINIVNAIHGTIMYLFAFKGKIKFGDKKVNTWHHHFIFSPIYTGIFSFFTVIGAIKQKFFPMIFITVLMEFLLRKSKFVKCHLPYSFCIAVQTVMYYIATFYKKVVFEEKHHRG